MQTKIPKGYKSILSRYETQKAIGLMKRLFEDSFSSRLNLFRVSAPLFVADKSGLNDNLSGVERPVEFEIKQTGERAQVVQSLAKWKRLALKRYDFYPGKGIYTDMNAIRRDEDELDNLHSVYVDQWDWEKIITEDERNLDYLKSVVMCIVESICDTQDTLKSVFPKLKTVEPLERRVSFIDSEDLLQLYPDKSPKEREDAYLKEHKTAFIMRIGHNLSNGEPHDKRAPDYDDWNLNGDILVWNEDLECAIELSSMGIRVDPETLNSQLTLSGCDDRRELMYHKMLLGGKLPLTIGGGIGQSRLSLIMLGKIHIAEVQASLWDSETVESLERAGIMML